MRLFSGYVCIALAASMMCSLVSSGGHAAPVLGDHRATHTVVLMDLRRLAEANGEKWSLVQTWDLAISETAFQYGWDNAWVSAPQAIAGLEAQASAALPPTLPLAGPPPQDSLVRPVEPTAAPAPDVLAASEARVARIIESVPEGPERARLLLVLAREGTPEALLGARWTFDADANAVVTRSRRPGVLDRAVPAGTTYEGDVCAALVAAAKATAVSGEVVGSRCEFQSPMVDTAVRADEVRIVGKTDAIMNMHDFIRVGIPCIDGNPQSDQHLS